MTKKHHYLIHIQYLGFRYHGWAKQTGLKTVHSMVDKTLEFVFAKSPEQQQFKTLGCSRTDAKVSANHFVFELFVDEKIKEEKFVQDFNSNLPNDIKALKIEETDSEFNIIQSEKIKEYIYLFSFGKKAHPFSASLLSSFKENLDIELMIKGASLFEGEHDFYKYCSGAGKSKDKNFRRKVLLSKIEENKIFTANFFPEKSYAYHIHAKGFMYNQIRLIVGQLLSLGRKEIDLEEIKNSLSADSQNRTKPLRNIAPASGLILNKVSFGN